MPARAMRKAELALDDVRVPQASLKSGERRTKPRGEQRARHGG